MLSLASALSLFLFLPHVFAASADQWKSRSIYQIITDRFALSNDSSATCNTEDRIYCGGSWKGIVNHLDYIQDMGFDAVWISPIVKNIEAETAYGYAYHGYWTQDINSLNSHYGSEDDLKSLATALHARGMYLMVDIVVNHFVQNPSSNSSTLPQTFDYSGLSPFSAETDFHPECFITDYNNQTNVEQCWLGDSNLPLMDIDTENSTVVQEWNSWVTSFVNTYSIDGLRIDTVKHIRKDFWPAFASAAGVFTIGEVLTDNITYTSDYTQVLDSVLDYPTWYPVVQAFNTTSGNLSAIQSAVTQAQSSYKNGLFGTGAFLENQDQPRFQSHTTDTGLVKNAISFPFIHDGIPILYQGQEQGYTGAADPFNREALWFSGYQEDKDLVTHIKAVNTARQLAVNASSSFLTTKMSFVSQSDLGAIAISKPPMLALLTNVGSSGSASWSVSGVYNKGETVVDVLTCKTYTVDSSSGTLSASADSGAPRIILPTSALKSDGTLCASAAGTSGAMSVNSVSRGALGISLVAGLILTFL
ncbi:related to alpha-amylase [Armillaria ostoyae]|uniref:alpha-amylase n=1 Tax=Armillaria ostoyae TaxID=47428 RepID=A0A284RF48_ARMOS|nr:related to alpha-amylase [Armillaria ostoyae]